MSITKLMADPKAAAIYASLDNHIHPAKLADDYTLAKLEDNKSLCLALECFIRDLARMHFNRPEVLQALSDMERIKAARRPGNGGSNALKNIADCIERDYAAGNFERLDQDRIRFTVNNLRVTCKDRPGAVAWMAAKYRRGMPKSRAGRYGTENMIVN